MTRRLLALLTAGALAAAPSSLSAQLSSSLSVAGGISLPMSDLGNTVDAGYNLAAGLNFGAPLIPLGVRLEGAYNSFNFKSGGGNRRAISGTANAVLALGPTGASPYLIGGVGLYNVNGLTALGATTTKTVGGVNGGAGIRFPLGLISTFIEARYHVALGNSSERTDWKFVPITFGVSF
jgi:hypothetical protein